MTTQERELMINIRQQQVLGKGHVLERRRVQGVGLQDVRHQ